jgi:hypothetical protein
MVRMAGSSFSRGMGTGSGMAFGLVGALVLVLAAGAAWYWLSEPIAPPRPLTRTVGTAEQAERIALSALRKKGVANLASEVRAVFVEDKNQWLIYGPAVTDDGRLVHVSMILSVGTFQGTKRWKVEIMEIDGKHYLGR